MSPQESRQSNVVSHGKWSTMRCRAECVGVRTRDGDVVEACSWEHRGTQAAVVAATSRHLKEHPAHMTWLERTQSRISWGGENHA